MDKIRGKTQPRSRAGVGMHYLIASDYGVIGNELSAALVSNLGSIDWCCFPYLDSPSHFGAVIDKNQGGRFQIMPQGEFQSKQRYVNKTHVLETLFETATGRGTLVDWMPVHNSTGAGTSLCRKIEVTQGSILWLLICTPRFRYGMDQAQAEKHHRGILFRGVCAEDLAVLHADIAIEITPNGAAANAQFSLDAGEEEAFLWTWGRRGILSESNSTSEFSRVQSPITPPLSQTIEYWKKLAHHCPAIGCIFGGPWHDLVTRSGLVLKLLMAQYSGAVAETITHSLKGSTPGSHTWGHRSASIREGAFILQALANLGFLNEAHRYFTWICEIIERDSAERLQSAYTLDGGKILPDRDLPYVNGHIGSGQFQLDIYGHVMITVSEYFKIFKTLPEGLWPKLVEIADYVCQAWRRPDYGPWSLTHKPEHFVVSKLFCWAALDHICKLARDTHRTPLLRWINEKNILHRTICEQGFDTTTRSFIRSFGDREIDSSLLWIPLLNFLPAEDPRVQSTLDAIQSQLSDGVLLRRYRNPYEPHCDEPMDLWSSFMLISCLALSGRYDEASDRLAEVSTHASSLGLFGDQIDLQHETMPKSFPSSSVHLGLINAAIYVGAARGRQKPMTSLLGEQSSASELRVEAGTRAKSLF